MFPPKLHILCSGVSNSDLMRLYINCTPCSMAKLSVSILQLMLWHYQEALRVQRTGDKFPEWPDLHPLRLTSVCLCSSFPQPTHTLKTHTHTVHYSTCSCTPVCLYVQHINGHSWMHIFIQAYGVTFTDLFIPQAALPPSPSMPQSSHCTFLDSDTLMERCQWQPLSLDPDSPAPDGWFQTC